MAVLDVPVNYREYAAKGIIESLRKLGICLLSVGPTLRAVPAGRIRKYPGLIHMCTRYQKEIARLLDAEVE